MVEDVIVLQLAVAVVVEIHPHLFAAVNAIPPENWRRTGRDPHPGKRVRVYLVLLDQTLALFVHVDPTVLTMMYFIMPNNRIGIGSNLYTS